MHRARVEGFVSVEWGISLGDMDQVALRVLLSIKVIRGRFRVSCTDPVMGKMMEATEAQEGLCSTETVGWKKINISRNPLK